MNMQTEESSILSAKNFPNILSTRAPAVLCLRTKKSKRKKSIGFYPENGV